MPTVRVPAESREPRPETMDVVERSRVPPGTTPKVGDIDPSFKDHPERHNPQ